VRKPVSSCFRSNALEIFARALEDCSPARLLSGRLAFEDNTIVGRTFNLRVRPGEKVRLFAQGKAARPMAGALVEILGKGNVRGAAVVPAGGGSAPSPLRTLRGKHPVPDAHSFRAAACLLRSMRAVEPGSIAVHLISGGASAMAAAPLKGLLSAPEKALLHRLLIESGLQIGDINVVRKHFSNIKGGRLAVQAPRARQITILLSDVPAGRLCSVGGGPTLPDPSTWDECMEILETSRILHELPAALRLRLSRRRWPETPKPSARLFESHVVEALADSSSLARAASTHARRLGFETHLLPGSVEETPDAFLGRLFEARSRNLRAAQRPRCWLAAGEVRVRRVGRGKGGRAQDLALAASIRLAGARGVLFLAAGSDGRDGNSPAAGALCDGTTFERAQRIGLDVERVHQDSNSYEVFRRLGDCVVTGPTENNLRDLYLLLEDPALAKRR